MHFWGDGGGVTHHPARQQAMTIHNVSEIAENNVLLPSQKENHYGIRAC